MTYEVRFKIAASQGGGTERVEVAAKTPAEAIVAANDVLEKKGINRWSLLKVLPVTS